MLSQVLLLAHISFTKTDSKWQSAGPLELYGFWLPPFVWLSSVSRNIKGFAEVFSSSRAGVRMSFSQVQLTLSLISTSSEQDIFSCPDPFDFQNMF